MLVFALHPPCLATTILGLTVASLVHATGTGTGTGTAPGLTGVETMSLVYVSAVGLLLAVGLAGLPAPATLEERA